MSIEEVYDGILFDVNQETPLDKKLSREDIISTGMGRSAVL